MADIRTHNIASFVEDNECLIRGTDQHFGEKPKIGVFHSLSVVTAVNHDPPGRGFAALILFDPPIYPTSGNIAELEALGNMFGESARRRRDRFETWEELAKTVRNWPTFALLLPGVADLYARTLLRSAADSKGYILYCPSEYEANIFEYLLAYTFEASAESFACPVKVIGADPTLNFSFLPGMDLTTLTGLEYDFVPDTTHFLQIEKPEVRVVSMLEFLERHGLV